MCLSERICKVQGKSKEKRHLPGSVDGTQEEDSRKGLCMYRAVEAWGCNGIFWGVFICMDWVYERRKKWQTKKYTDRQGQDHEAAAECISVKEMG